jgi:hypothetical protein
MDLHAPNTPLPCPICGSTDLVVGDWCIDEHPIPGAAAGEVPSIECQACLTGAPWLSWQLRAFPRARPCVEYLLTPGAFWCRSGHPQTCCGPAGDCPHYQASEPGRSGAALWSWVALSDLPMTPPTDAGQ